ncbi:fatty acid synthase-like [Bemisia tabaci]|uniref:fatty acid synthase-like n=1 Tax=Bemisia tabaci TaxID=7038 RepID=UPI003B27BA23
MKEKVEVVISGTAGVFPECKNIPQLEEALFNNVHLVTDDDRKWKQGYSFPTHCGKAFSHDHFDAIFFKVPFNLPYTMDAIAKQSLETSVEAIIDAGVNPKSLAGSRTAVYSMYDFSEMELSIAYTQMVKVLLGSARTFTANRLSFALDLHGPSYTSQGGAGAIFHLIEIARSQLEERTIDAAIVVSGNFLLTARSLAILDGMGLAAKDGKCRPFDKKANGYALSESCVAFFLQRESDARRNWATVVGADHKFFGQKQGSILAFDGRPAKEMLRQLYSRCQVDPASVCYIEADGSGVKVSMLHLTCALVKKH